jgi:large subunit ribosomal protein L22
MEVRATAKYIRVQPRKVRIVADQVKGKPAAEASVVLGFHPSKGARELRKALNSAIANAAENAHVSPENLRIRAIRVDEGPRLKRITQKSMGRGARITKKMSHITVVVEDYQPAGRVKPHGTKPKPRPTLAPKAGKKKGNAPAAKADAVTPEVVPTDTPTEEVKALGADETQASQGEA